MELDFKALNEDAASARASLYKAYCKHANDQRQAVIALATGLLFQALQTLEATYNDPELARKHIKELI